MPKTPSSRIRRAKPCPCTTTSTIRPSWLEKLNGLIEDTEFAKSPLAEIVIKASGGTFNNGAQAWNHAFFWQCLRPDGDGGLGIETHGNAGNPLTDGRLPLLTCDRWEHDYYVDYRNEKKRSVDAFWHLINWNVAAQNMQRKGPFNLKAAVGRCPRCARDVHRVP
ncbi:superoxide dismutase [Thioflavicoccus mobilis 8321]|uniref:Superoxide dismutase n=1 Tax=Thioflavicoccus mobilis 8321 TaxID=765912 RepID=L0GWV1_9GAMM|nr:superoxide dismutase [Thioflavicoccus mobilis 8321]